MAETGGTTTKNTSRRPFWQKHLRAWSQSGLTQADYCRQHKLSAPAFGWWKRQLEGKPRPPKRSPAAKQTERGDRPAVRFVEVQRGSAVDAGGSPAVYEVLLSKGRAIRVGRVFDPEVLKRLITTVEASC
jgi:hypothetical protein